MRWNIIVDEESAGVYLLNATSEDGMIISESGQERSVGKFLKDIYLHELSLGATPCRASYDVTRSYLFGWKAVFHERMFGCWTVGEDSNFPRVDYDGRDFYLMVSESADCYSWQGSVEMLAKGRSGYFEKIVTFPRIPTRP